MASSTMGPRNLVYKDTRVKEGQNPRLNMQQLAVSRFEPVDDDPEMHYSESDKHQEQMEFEP